MYNVCHLNCFTVLLTNFFIHYFDTTKTPTSIALLSSFNSFMASSKFVTTTATTRLANTNAPTMIEKKK